MEWEHMVTQRQTGGSGGGSFVVVELDVPHRVISTSARTGGEASGVRRLVNHQSCEGAGHDARAHLMLDEGPERYHDRVCAEIGAAPASTAVMGTAASMHYVAVARERDLDVEAVAIVTAGVHSNATCAGDPARWREGADGVVPAVAVAGTINTMLVVSRALTAPALARAVITIRDARARRWPAGDSDRASRDLATGTGPISTRRRALDAIAAVAADLDSPHMKLGESSASPCARDVEAMRWITGRASYSAASPCARRSASLRACGRPLPDLDSTALELLASPALRSDGASLHRWPRTPWRGIDRVRYARCRPVSRRALGRRRRAVVVVSVARRDGRVPRAARRRPGLRANRGRRADADRPTSHAGPLPLSAAALAAAGARVAVAVTPELSRPALDEWLSGRCLRIDVPAPRCADLAIGDPTYRAGKAEGATSPREAGLRMRRRRCYGGA